MEECLRSIPGVEFDEAVEEVSREDQEFTKAMGQEVSEIEDSFGNMTEDMRPAMREVEKKCQDIRTNKDTDHGWSRTRRRASRNSWLF